MNKKGRSSFKTLKNINTKKPNSSLYLINCSTFNVEAIIMKISIKLSNNLIPPNTYTFPKINLRMRCPTKNIGMLKSK
jgi:hypothetical protein